MSPTIRILIGAPVSGSEAVFLRELYNFLHARVDALLFVNFEIKSGAQSTQIDFVVITPNRAELVELKCLDGPVHGTENGPWRVTDRSGIVSDYPGKNPWVQARDAKLTLNDKMRSFQKRNASAVPAASQRYFSLDSCVCLYPDRDPASKLTSGNFKAWVRSYPELCNALISKPLAQDWTSEIWFRFGKDFVGLQEASLKAAIDDKFAAAESTVLSYLANLRRLVESNLPPLLTSDSEETCGDTLVKRLSSDRNQLLLGPSGLGKSHHLHHLILRAIEGREIPILLEGRHYTGNFSHSLSKSLSPLTSDVSALLRSIKELQVKPLLIVDGLNYCRENSEDLLRDMLSFQRHYGARIVSSSQNKPQLPGGLDFDEIRLAPLRMAHKVEIFSYHSRKACDSSLIRHVCEGFDTAYDLSVAGTVTRPSNQKPVTRAQTYELYCRQRVPEKFGSVIPIFLREIGSVMASDTSYLIPRREFEHRAEDFAAKGELSLSFLDALRQCPLIVVTDDTVFFEHDLLRDYFASEDFLQRFTDPQLVGQELNRTRNQALAQFVVPRFETPELARNLIQSLESGPAISDGFRGYLGPTAQHVIEGEFDALLQRASSDLANIDLQFEVAERNNGKRFLSWPRVVNAHPWSGRDFLLCDVIADNFEDERLCSKCIDLMQLTEWRLRVLAESQAASSGTSQSGAWSETFRMSALLETPHMQIPATRILRKLRHRLGFSRRSRFTTELRKKLLETASRDRHDFELFVLLQDARLKDVPLEERINLFKLGLRSRVYYVKSEAIMVARFSASELLEGNDKLLSEVVEHLEAIPSNGIFLNTDVAEALSMLGALESVVPEGAALAEAKAILNSFADGTLDAQTASSRAYGFVSLIFEEIYSSDYYDAYRALLDEERTRLLCLAAMEPVGFSTAWVIAELSSHPSPEALPVFRHYAAQVAADTPNPQEASAAYLLGVYGCGKLGQYPWPEEEDPETDDALAWRLVGKLLLNSFSPESGKQSDDDIWSLIETHCHLAVADALYRVVYEGSALVKDLEFLKHWEIDTKRLRPILEGSLARRRELTSVFKWGGPHDVRLLYFIVSELGRIGNRDTLRVLKEVVDDPALGKFALEAIRQIEAGLQRGDSASAR